SLLPGMPTLLFVGIASALALYAGAVERGQELESTQQKQAAADAEAPKEGGESPVEDLLAIDRLGIEIGYRLIGLVEPGQHGGLLDHIRSLRRQFAQALGVVVPPIRV